MTTQPLMPGKGLSLSMPIGDGRREVVDLPTEDVDSALLVAPEQQRLRGQILPGFWLWPPPVDTANYRNVVDGLLTGEWWNPRRIFVTSPTAGDGKTCTAFNLAWALSTRGASVLLIELNFTRPRFSSALGGLQIRFGVDCAIRGLAQPPDTVFSLGNVGVSAVKNGMRRGELKQHLPRLVSYLGWGENNYHWLILDCPPVLSFAWNSWFREYARPALLVVREQHTPAVQVRQAVSRLGYRLKGVLLNDVASAGASDPTPDAD